MNQHAERSKPLLAEPEERCPHMSLKQTLPAVFIALILSMSLSSPALADPAEPTNYESEILKVTPDFADIELDMIGGDSFIRLRNHGRHKIMVMGYRAEPFLRFDTDGTVWENIRAPSRWLSAARYADAYVPATADSQAPPKWEQVSDNGVYAWHDHRTHWMNKAKPPAAKPGERILELTVPLTVDGTEVDITVVSYILAPPSKIPTIIGAVAGLGLAVVIYRSRRIQRIAATVAISALSLVAGATAYKSVPVETEPVAALWVLPFLAIALSLGALFATKKVTTTVFLDGFTAASAALVAYWSFLRRSALVKSLIPSNFPAPADRLIITLVFCAAIGLSIFALMALTKPEQINTATKQ